MQTQFSNDWRPPPNYITNTTASLPTFLSSMLLHALNHLKINLTIKKLLEPRQLLSRLIEGHHLNQLPRPRPSHRLRVHEAMDGTFPGFGVVHSCTRLDLFHMR